MKNLASHPLPKENGTAMFTGLIEQIGIVDDITAQDSGKRISITCQGINEIPENGASVSVSGCCLTVVKTSASPKQLRLVFDVVQESLNCTTLGSLQIQDTVNLEQALRADTKMGGHFVQGHIDCVETILQCNQEEGERRVRLSMHSIDVDLIVLKGSITLDGVSLTIAKVLPDSFEVVLIPTTLEETTFATLNVGDRVNVESDILARTVVQMIRRMKAD